MPFNANPLPNVPPLAESLEAFGRTALATYQRLELQLLGLLDEAVRRGLDTEAIAERAAIAFELQERARLLLADLDTGKLASDIVTLAADEGDRAALARLGMASNIPTVFSGFSTTQALGIASIASQLAGGFTGMHASILRSTADTYQRVVADVTAQVLGGGITRYQAGREATRQLVHEGGVFVEYANGARMPIGSYAEMATRTAANRAWQEGTIGRLESNGIHLVTIVVGIGACKYCAKWSGRVLSTDGRTGDIEVEHATDDTTVIVHVDGTLDQARAQHWNHPNCRCSIAAYFPGLRAAGSRTTYDPDAEAARTKLRQLERDKRRALLDETLAPDDLARRTAGRRVRDLNGRIDAHVKSTGLVRQRQRESLIFTGQKPPRTPAPRPVVDPPKPPRAPAPRPKAPENRPEPVGTPPSTPPGVQNPTDVLGPRPPTSLPRGAGMGEIREAQQRLFEWDKAAQNIERNNLIATAPAPLSPAARRAAFEAAPNGKAVGEVLSRELQHRGITVSGFTARQSVETLREYANTITDLLDEYPQVIMHEVNVVRTGRGVYAQVKSSPSTGRVAMELSNQFANDREALIAGVARDVAAGFHPQGFELEPVRGIIAHEFGHAIDAQTAFSTGKAAQRISEELGASLGYRSPSKEFSDWRRSQVPGYGYTNNGTRYNGIESLAEAFADVELNGPRASALHRELVARLLRTIGR